MSRVMREMGRKGGLVAGASMTAKARRERAKVAAAASAKVRTKKAAAKKRASRKPKKGA